MFKNNLNIILTIFKERVVNEDMGAKLILYRIGAVIDFLIGIVAFPFQVYFKIMISRKCTN